MEIRPLYDNTIKMSVSDIKLESFKGVKTEKEIYKDVPNGILKVVKWEFFRQFITMGITGLLILGSIILFILFSTSHPVAWTGYILPICVISISTWKILITFFERQRLKKDLVRYKEDIKMGLLHYLERQNQSGFEI